MESKKGIAMITQKQIRAWIPPALETFRKYYPLPEDPPYHIINEYPDNPRSIMFTTPENEIFIVRSQVDYSKSSPGKYRQLFNHHYWHELGHVVSKINSPKMSAIFWSEFAAEAMSLKICRAENNTPMAETFRNCSINQSPWKSSIHTHWLIISRAPCSTRTSLT